MNRDIRKDLISARDEKFLGNYKGALKLFEKAYRDNPDAFKYVQREDYAWTIYKVYVSKVENEADLFESVEFITSLVPQKDLNASSSCVYTLAVFKIFRYLDERKDYYAMLYWLDKINPELLDDRPYRKYGRINKSRREKYFDYASRTYMKTKEYEECVRVSKLALDTFDSLMNDGGAWHCWRIGKSLNRLRRFDEALVYLKEALDAKHEWYMYREIAEAYCMLRKPFDALEYACPVILSRISDSTKINIYYLVYRILKGFNPEEALKHAQFFYLLKRENGYMVPQEIEDLNIDESELDKNQLKREIIDVWTRYKFRNEKIHHGTVTKFFDEKNYGFIRTEDGKSIFFHRDEFQDGMLYAGQSVSFYTERSFDKSKNRESMKAVYIRGE